MSRALLSIFAEDFDRATAPAEPPSGGTSGADDADLRARERAEAWQEGYDAGLAAARADTEAADDDTAERIGRNVQAMTEGVLARIDRDAQELAGLMLAILERTFPVLCREYGAGEIAAVARHFIPPLERAAHIQVTVCARQRPRLEALIGTFDQRMTDKISVIADESAGPADIAISWPDGSVQREAAQIWDSIVSALGLHGLTAAHRTIPEPEGEIAHVD